MHRSDVNVSARFSHITDISLTSVHFVPEADVANIGMHSSTGSRSKPLFRLRVSTNLKVVADKGSVYVEFDVPAESLLQGGKDSWFKMIGPDVNKSQQFLLNNQGSEHLLAIKNIKIPDRN